MKNFRRYRSVLTVLLMTALLVVSIDRVARSDSGDEAEKTTQEKVLQHRLSKDILSFKEIMAIAAENIRGEIIESEFEDEDDVPIYEIKYIDPSGRVKEVYIDARTGDILKVKDSR